MTWLSAGLRLILGGVFGRVRKWFDGAGWYVGLAAALFIFALLATVVELQTPNAVLWTGQTITGTEKNGLIYYRWHGQAYTADVPGNGNATNVTIYLDPSDPTHATTNSVSDRIEAGLLVAFPAAAGIVILILGGTRNYRWSRRVSEDPWEKARGQW